MPTINPKIQGAFNGLVEITEQELGSIFKSCTASMNKNDYDAARVPFEQAAVVSKFLKQLTELRKGWDQLLGEVREAKPEIPKAPIVPKEKAVKPPADSKPVVPKEEPEIPKEKPAISKMKAVKAPVVSKLKITRLPMGTLASIEAFTRPILQALVDMGGKGVRREIIERLLKSMNKTFTKYDFGFTPSRPKAPRWHDTLDRAYKLMRKSGLLSTDTPIGIWEISQKGRDFLKESSAK